MNAGIMRGDPVCRRTHAGELPAPFFIDPMPGTQPANNGNILHRAGKNVILF
jgi:hypothetical protein